MNATDQEIADKKATEVKTAAEAATKTDTGTKKTEAAETAKVSV
jgi:hypothetical protein